MLPFVFFFLSASLCFSLSVSLAVCLSLTLTLTFFLDVCTYIKTGDWSNGKRDGVGMYISTSLHHSTIHCSTLKCAAAHCSTLQRTAAHVAIDTPTNTGDWSNGKRDGVGIYTSELGATFEGEWKQGLRHGQVGIHESQRKFSKVSSETSENLCVCIV